MSVGYDSEWVNAELWVSAAWVNKSSYSIAVYDRCDIIKPGGAAHGAGGNQIGTIYPNEFYTSVPRTVEWDNDEYIKICFRNSDGEQDVGYIEPRPGGIATMLEPWVDKQEHYADYNSNGYSLVSAETEVIGGRTYAIFTVKHTVDYLDRYGTTKGYLFDGDQIAIDESTTGQSNWGYMLFEKVKREDETSWSNLTPSGYGFVNLGLHVGSEPSTRPIW